MSIQAKIKKRRNRLTIADILIWLVVTLLTVICLLPLLNTLAVSLSSSVMVAAGKVNFWPMDFTWNAYQEIVTDKLFASSIVVSIKRVIIGGALNVAMILLVAFPLSHTKRDFYARDYYMWFLLATMLFSGGLIPSYIVISEIGLLDTIWALTLPGAVSSWNCILMMNFFRSLPKTLEEAALIDGAQPITVLTKIFIPLALPGLATVTLFSVVGHWNDFFSGMIYMNHNYNYPLATYINTLVYSLKNLDQITDPKELERIMKMSDTTLNSAKIFVAMIPILLVYPFMQRYFVTGLVMGSVKE